MPMSLNPMFVPGGNNTFFLQTVFSAPIIIAIIQLLLMIFIFDFDTPPVMKQRGQLNDLRRVMTNIYHPSIVQERIDAIPGNGKKT